MGTIELDLKDTLLMINDIKSYLLDVLTKLFRNANIDYIELEPILKSIINIYNTINEFENKII